MVLWGFLWVGALVILGFGVLLILGVGALVILGFGALGVLWVVALVILGVVLYNFRGWSFGYSGIGCFATW